MAATRETIVELNSRLLEGELENKRREKDREQSGTWAHSILQSQRFVQQDILDTIVLDFSLHVVIYIEIKFIFFKLVCIC